MIEYFGGRLFRHRRAASETVRGAATTPTLLAPHGMLEGAQDITNSAYVVGWAWNRSKPDTPIGVEVWDGGSLLATIVADAYRKDLRDAGKGNGRHAFMYSFPEPIRDRRSHQITVRVAGTNVALRDPTSGALPEPVTRRDRPTTARIPHFSMPPLQRWWYFTMVRHFSRVCPRPVWRPPALALGIIHMVCDRQSRVLNLAILRALGMSVSLGNRWRLHWSRAYQRQAYLWLLPQSDRITPRWAARNIRFDGCLPPGGAILVSVHHNAMRFAHLTLAARSYRLGMVTSHVHDPIALAHVDATLRTHWQLTYSGDGRSLGDRRFSRRKAGRKGLRLLAEGGNLIVIADDPTHRTPFSPLLGRAMTVPPGVVWFAQRSGKPIIPFMVVPEGLHWRLWLGEAVAPTQGGLCNALEQCIRHAPGSWQRFVAMSWLTSPAWDKDDASFTRAINMQRSPSGQAAVRRATSKEMAADLP